MPDDPEQIGEHAAAVARLLASRGVTDVQATTVLTLALAQMIVAKAGDDPQRLDQIALLVQHSIQDFAAKLQRADRRQN